LSRKFELIADEHKQVCRVFVELYFCLDRLEDITQDFIIELEKIDASYNCIFLVDLFHKNLRNIETLSQRFFDISFDLYLAIELYSPDLTYAVQHICYGKCSFMDFISNSIRLENQNKSVKYYKPSTRILKIDIEQYYNWVAQNQGKKVLPKKHEWSIDMLKNMRFKEEFSEEVIEINDIRAIQEFRNILIEHGKVLTSAKEKLREFIIKNFELEDVLYISKKIPHYK